MQERRVERAVTAGIMVLAALVGVVLVSGGAATRASRATGPAAERHTTFARAPSRATTTTTPATTTAGPATTATTAAAAATTTTAAPSTTDPGALPQTDEKPTATGATFTAGVHALWEAIRQDQPALGLAFFFPQRAYLQVKAISDPASDYQSRLIANFAQDVHTLHAQLGPNAASAQFVGITVPGDQAVLVQPGQEYNKLSYWRVYGTTVQYQVDGRSGSFPVTSLISWRGQWYVVHLGAIR